MVKKFKEKIDKIIHGTTRPMGFGRSESSAAARPFLMVEVTTATDNSLEAADAVLYSYKSRSVAVLGPMVGYAGGTKKKADFRVFTLAAEVPVQADDEPAAILRVSEPLEDTMLRAVNGLPVEAVIVDPGLKETLSWQNLLHIRRLAELVYKPLIVTIPAGYNNNELKLLWRAGIEGVLINASQADIPDLKKKLEKLGPRQVPGEMGAAILPRANPVLAREAPPEDEPEPEIEPAPDDE